MQCESGSSHIKGRWSTKEDALLRAFVNSIGINRINWKNIPEIIPGRSSKQCRDRWFNHLDATLKPADNWEPEEDATLWVLVECYGRKWTHIARIMPGRSDNGLQIRYNRLRQLIVSPSSVSARKYSFVPPDVTSFLATRPMLQSKAMEVFGFSMIPIDHVKNTIDTDSVTVGLETYSLNCGSNVPGNAPISKSLNSVIVSICDTDMKSSDADNSSSISSEKAEGYNDNIARIETSNGDGALSCFTLVNFGAVHSSHSPHGISVAPEQLNLSSNNEIIAGKIS